MNHDYDDESERGAGAPARSTNPFDRTHQQAVAPDPHDDGLDDSFMDDYEEPERDTVQAGGSTEMYYEEEEDIEDLFAEDQPFADEVVEIGDGPTLALVEEGTAEALFPEAEEEVNETEPEAEEWPTTGMAASLAATRWQEEPLVESESDDDWQDDEEEFLEDNDTTGPPWPYGLIAVAVLALVLLVAGGYGVIQQRQATEEEIRQLRAELATTASPTDLTASRQALQDMNAQNEELSRQVASLERDNRRLTDTVAGLEAQLDAQQTALNTAAGATTSPQAAAPQPAAAVTEAPKPAADKAVAAATAPTGSWFVNFGSYGREPIAREWAGKLSPDSGEAVLVAAEVNGRNIFRVRVVGLNSRDAAERVARQLEATYGLPKLWVGKQ